MKHTIFLTMLLATMIALIVCAEEKSFRPIKLAADPSLSPDGSVLAFSWNRDIWTVPASGGVAKRFTHNDAHDVRPSFSPDGKQMAFSSNRDGNWSIYVAPSVGGLARRATVHSEGERLLEWSADGASFYYLANRDMPFQYFPQLFTKRSDGGGSERAVLNFRVTDAKVSRNGSKILFTREGESPYRPGYSGSKVSQIWIYDVEQKDSTKLLASDFDNRSPMWNPEGTGFYYVSAEDGTPNLWKYSLKRGRRTQLTFFKKDFIGQPVVSHDGRTIVFRHLFDFYRFFPASGNQPEKIEIKASAEVFPNDVELRSFKTATAITYSHDNLEIAFVAGGDLWIMDTVLREPVRVVKSPLHIVDSVFSQDHQGLYYIASNGISANIFKATRSDSTKAWWENREFVTTQVTEFEDRVLSLTLSKDGKTFVYCRGSGDLWVADADFNNHRKVFSCWNVPYYTLSPDSKWLAFSLEDSYYNRDIWLAPLDNSRPPFNISRNPEWDGSPAWSPDGSILSWCGKNMDKSTDIFYVYLDRDDALESPRDRKLIQARKAMTGRKVRKTVTPIAKKAPAEHKVETAESETADRSPEKAPKKKNKAPKEPVIPIDFDDILRRVRRISTPGINEFCTVWAPDSKRLIFRNNTGKKGTYQVIFPDKLKPTFLSPSKATWFKWDSAGKTLYGMEGGGPVTLKGTTLTKFQFNCLTECSRKNENRLLFNSIWQTMNESFYREDMNGSNWRDILEKYRPIAEMAPDTTVFRRAVNLMLGELNASHTGFFLKDSQPESGNAWKKITAHSGLLFDPGFKGPGLKIQSIIKYGPAYKYQGDLQVGDRVLEINGKPIDYRQDWQRVMYGTPRQLLRLLVKNEGQEEKTITIESTSYGAIRDLRFRNHLKEQEKYVEEKSQNRFAYIHVKSMNWSSFEKFQKEIFSRGFGKQGLIIDVRDNAGGFTADHLLTVLTQPRHAVTIPRGASPGYPLTRSVYTYWHNPIVVLCNQNSFSNAEIFCHAIKTLKRGKLVGVRTAGGVISTGAVNILGKGTLRLPFRGWYTLDGKDMELNGAEPDIEIWPQPGDTVKGIDRQLDKAIEVLLDELK